MNKCQVAGFFDVSRGTVNDWLRRGCPIGKSGELDPGTVGEWRTRRKLSQEGLDAIIPGLPELVGEFIRRLIALDKRIAAVNQWPEDMEAEPGVIKAAVVSGLILERELLTLPGRVLAEGKPETLPEDIHRIVLAALDEARAENKPRTRGKRGPS